MTFNDYIFIFWSPAEWAFVIGASLFCLYLKSKEHYPGPSKHSWKGKE
jgi:hypothetical protein